MAKKAKRYALGEAVQPPQKKLDTGPVRIDPNSPHAIENRAYWAAQNAKVKRAKAKTVRKGTQAKRKASRSPGGYQAGGSFQTPDYDPDWKAKKLAAIAKKRKENKRAAAKTVRKGKQAKRKASRSPGGFAGGGAIESYSAQVQRKYGGGKV